MSRPHRPAFWRSLTVAKAGHRADENEDASAADPNQGRFALADGASESAYAGLWARLLVDGFVSASTPDLAARSLAALREDWASRVDGKSVEWYVEAKREAGSYATFLGLTLLTPEEDGKGRWQALAVGDSCLFHVRDGDLLASFPMTESQNFDSSPHLIGSRETAGLPAVQQAHGRWRAGDWFLLMTDAFAHWFLRESEEGSTPWVALVPSLGEYPMEELFEQEVTALRDAARLRNDDVTLIAIEV